MDFQKLIVYVDMDDVLCDFFWAHQADLVRNPSIAYPQSIPGFFAKLQPLPGAIEGFRFLFDHPDLDVYILTAPSVLNTHCYTEKREWVERYLGLDVAHKTIISPNKALSIGDYLIDDNTEGKGQDGFAGELIHFGSHDFPDWPCIVRYFESILAARQHQIS